MGKFKPNILRGEEVAVNQHFAVWQVIFARELHAMLQLYRFETLVVAIFMCFYCFTDNN